MLTFTSPTKNIFYQFIIVSCRLAMYISFQHIIHSLLSVTICITQNVWDLSSASWHCIAATRFCVLGLVTFFYFFIFFY